VTSENCVVNGLMHHTQQLLGNFSSNVFTVYAFDLCRLLELPALLSVFSRKGRNQWQLLKNHAL